MIILYIYLGISAITFIMYTLTLIDMTHKFKIKYPELKIPKSTLARKILTFMKLVISAFIPILNIGLCWVVLFNYEELETKTFEKTYCKCMEE